MNEHRLCDKNHTPSIEEIYSIIGLEAKEAWHHLCRFAEENYDHEAELNFGGKNYGWNIRYRKSGKTLFSIFPERGCFTVLLVLGKKEIETYRDKENEFGEPFKTVFESAPQFHDGRWLWMKVNDIQIVKDIERMIMIKKKPLKARAR